MAPKAKAKASAGGGDGDDAWENFQKIYQKSLKSMGIHSMADTERILGLIEEQGDSFKGCWNFTEPVDRMGFQVLMHSLREAK